jgi:hypothetical protein
MDRLIAISLLSTAGAFAPSNVQSQQHLGRTSLSADVAVLETPPSPLTEWGEEIRDIRGLQQQIRDQELPEFGPEIFASDLGIASGDKDAQLAYFKENAMEIKKKMSDHGAVIFRGFDLMKEQDGFQAMYNALEMKICQDPLQSVSARPTADGKKDSPVYEAVNKESRKNFFIGKFFFFIALSNGLKRLFDYCAKCFFLK